MAKAYEILISPLPDEEGGGFVALVPDLHGCMADGDTQEEALENAKDAIAAWCEAQVAAGREIPDPGAARSQYMKEENQIIEALQQQTELIQKLQGRVKVLEGSRASVQQSYARITGWQVQAPSASLVAYAKKREIGAI